AVEGKLAGGERRRRPRLAARHASRGGTLAGPGCADCRGTADEELLSNALRESGLCARARADHEPEPHRFALSEAGTEARVLLGRSAPDGVSTRRALGRARRFPAAQPFPRAIDDHASMARAASRKPSGIEYGPNVPNGREPELFLYSRNSAAP